MKQVIKLTESDITRIVKRVIKEEKLSKQDVLKKHVLKSGWNEVAERIGGFDNLYRIGFNNDYDEFLKLYSDLEVIQSKQKPDWMLYRFGKDKNIMAYDKKNGYVYINNNVIWSFFDDGFDIKFDDIQGIMTKWLDEVYNLRGVTPHPQNVNLLSLLD